MVSRETSVYNGPSQNTFIEIVPSHVDATKRSHWPSVTLQLEWSLIRRLRLSGCPRRSRTNPRSTPTRPLGTRNSPGDLNPAIVAGRCVGLQDEKIAIFELFGTDAGSAFQKSFRNTFVERIGLLFDGLPWTGRQRAQRFHPFVLRECATTPVVVNHTLLTVPKPTEPLVWTAVFLKRGWPCAFCNVSNAIFADNPALKQQIWWPHVVRSDNYPRSTCNRSTLNVFTKTTLLSNCDKCR